MHCRSSCCCSFSVFPKMRASGIDCIFVRQFIESDQDRDVYSAVPMPVDATLTTCLGQAQFLREKALGVVPQGDGFGIRIKFKNFEEVLLLLQQGNATNSWEQLGTFPFASGNGQGQIARIPGAMEIHPFHTFRQGFRRTWIVRATEKPIERIVYHDFDLPP